MRGEKLELGETPTSKTGSPPLARGKEGIRRKLQAFSGITPACAGKRGVNDLIAQIVEDHPRLRGEKQRYGR